ncbi:MAG: hypothetical protein QM737_15430 [Ferruginibacter sp.]
MICCDNLIHPFQNDPGVSQRQRVIEDLLSGAPRIDGRTMADLLNYFTQLSQKVNYYDNNLIKTNWKGFFKGSRPFSLAAIIKYDLAKTRKKFEHYNRLFDKEPGRHSLQLLIHFIYYHTVQQVNQWHNEVKGSELKVEVMIEKLIKDKMKEHVKQFICLTNISVQKYRIKKIDFNPLRNNEAWGLNGNDTSASSGFVFNEPTKRKRLIALRNKIIEPFSGFLNAMTVAGNAAELSIEQSMFPVKEEFQKLHSPHLALLFSFLKLFGHLQSDLNGFTKKHLDFFYQDVLKIRPREAVPDKAHIIFEIQKQLDKYRLVKGLAVKDGKDINKAEVNFSLDDEIIVNKTEVADVKTLFLNNKNVFNSSYIEGAYIAPDARKADGVKIDFKDDAPKNWPTVGAKYSKYTLPEQKKIKPYPFARLGFILASQVLLLNEGTRTVTIQLACELDQTVCDGAGIVDVPVDPCCGRTNTNDAIAPECKPPINLPIDPTLIIDNVSTALKKVYCFINEDLIEEAGKKGIDIAILKKIRNRFLSDQCYHAACCGNERKYLSESFVSWCDWSRFLRRSVPVLSDKKILNEVFTKRRALRIFFSGEKEWIQPDVEDILNIDLVTYIGNKFVLTVEVNLKPDKPAVTFYDAEKLKEDFDTKLPLVKIELDNDIGLVMNKKLRKQLGLVKSDITCCLFNEITNCKDKLSLYHFFKYARVIEKIGIDKLIETDITKIDVKVCGLKNFIVQNDESVQDVNSPIYAFGALPKKGANFYIGCEEVFFKKWTGIRINHTWKDVPPISDLPAPLFGTRFRAYYNGYQDFFIESAAEVDFVIDDNFQMEIAILQDGQWNPWSYGVNCDGSGGKSKLFQERPEVVLCDDDLNYDYQYQIDRKNDFIPVPDGLVFPKEEIYFKGLKRLNVDTRQSFIRITLKCQDFKHDKYPFVLARQMTALGKLPNIVDGAVYFGVELNGVIPHFEILNIPVLLRELLDIYNSSITPAGFNLDQNTINLINNIIVAADPAHRGDPDLQNIWNQIFTVNDPSIPAPGLPVPTFSTGPFATTPSPLDESHSYYYYVLHKILDWLSVQAAKVKDIKEKGVVIPNLPWTPIITKIALDYTATATISDIDLIHLHPFDGTHQQKEIELKPTLFPTFCDEGNLFIGLKELVPGTNLNILFQLAEATADSESEREELRWYYLDKNQWKNLRDGFEVLNDATNGLTTSGIIKFAMPENMTKDNTIMPKNIHWIKATITSHSKSVSETIGIHPQAIEVVFTNEEENDRLRLDKALPAKSISKLTEADANVKKVEQPYDSFGGREPEVEKHYYLRVSELLRHKGRAIQKWDYEHIVLEAFPQVFKAKCVNHSYALNANEFKNDFPLAPGYVLLAVIPDLTKLASGNSFQPKVPVSLLEDISTYVRKRTSPFVRLRVMNPRYEKVHLCLKVKLIKGKDENYYKEKLETDLRDFLAPWAIGEFDKLRFGQCINRSDLLRFIEGLEYLDYIIELKMMHETDAVMDGVNQQVCPKTPRSILFAGEIDICIKQDDCEEWGKCYNDQQQLIDCCSNKSEPVISFCK